MDKNHLSELENTFFKDKNNPLIKTQLNDLINNLKSDDYMNCLDFLLNSSLLDAYPSSIEKLINKISLDKLTPYINQVMPNLNLVDDVKLILVKNNYDKLDEQTQEVVNNTLIQLITDHMFVLTHIGLEDVAPIYYLKKIIQTYELNLNAHKVFSDGVYIPHSTRFDESETQRRFELLYEFLKDINFSTMNLDEINAFDLYHQKVIAKYSQSNSYNDKFDSLNQLRERLYKEKEAKELDSILVKIDKNSPKKLKV
jgi:hypothetical protein